jgi:hypothetical protein
MANPLPGLGLHGFKHNGNMITAKSAGCVASIPARNRQ